MTWIRNRLLLIIVLLVVAGVGWAQFGPAVSDEKNPRHITVLGNWAPDAESARVYWRIYPSDYKGDFTSTTGKFKETRIMPVGKYTVTVVITPKGSNGRSNASVQWVGGSPSQRSQGGQPVTCIVTVVIK